MVRDLVLWWIQGGGTYVRYITIIFVMKLWMNNFSYWFIFFVLRYCLIFFSFPFLSDHILSYLIFSVRILFYFLVLFCFLLFYSILLQTFPLFFLLIWFSILLFSSHFLSYLFYQKYNLVLFINFMKIILYDIIPYHVIS